MKSEKLKVESVSLGSVAEFDRTAADLTKRNGLAYISLEDIDSDNGAIRVVERADPKSTKYAFSSEHVLYGKLRPNLRKVARPDFSGICSTDIIPIRPSKRLDRDYLFHFLRTPAVTNLATKLAVGINLPRLSPKQLSTFDLPLPTFKAQRRIAEILDRAEALRAKRRAALALLDELTQSIFLDMFGDPVSNPKGWEHKTLGDSLTFQLYGPRFYNEKYTDDGIRIVRITDLDFQGNLDFDSMPRLDVCEEDREKYCLKAGDILFARTGATVGKVALIQTGAPECIAGAYFIVMRFADELDPLYVRSVLTSKSIQAIVWIRSQQSAQQNFSGPGLRALPMPLPPIKLQKLFAKRIAAVEVLREPHRVSLSELDQLFASLQHRAFRGEL